MAAENYVLTFFQIMHSPFVAGWTPKIVTNNAYWDLQNRLQVSDLNLTSTSRCVQIS